MIGWRRRLVGGCGALSGLIAVAALCSTPGWAADVSDLADDPRLPRAEGAWLIEAAELPEARQTLVLGPVERERREVRYAASRSFRGTAVSRTYELPREQSLAALEDHYQRLLSGHLVYRCSGRGCGRSNDWANTVFERATLYGPDGQQRYFAAQLDDELVALYLVRRGNRRLYVHQVVYQPNADMELARVPTELADLRRMGRLRIAGVRPDRNGELTMAEQRKLQTLATQLVGSEIPALYVVCHLYAQDRLPPPDQRRSRQPKPRDDTALATELLAASTRCAEQAASVLNQDDGPRILPFGVGPLAPSGARRDSRLVLVLPQAD